MNELQKAKIEAKEFWVEKFNGFKNPTYYAWAEKPEKLSMIKIKIDDGDPIAASEYFHVIEHKAYASALDDIRMLEAAIRKSIAYADDYADSGISAPIREALKSVTEKYPEIKEKA